MNKNFKIVALIFFVYSNAYVSASYVRQFLSVYTPESAVQERRNGFIANEHVAEMNAIRSASDDNRWITAQFAYLQRCKQTDYLGLKGSCGNEAAPTDEQLDFLRPTLDPILKIYGIFPQGVALKYHNDEKPLIFAIGLPKVGMFDHLSGKKIYGLIVSNHSINFSSGAVQRCNDREGHKEFALSHEGAHLRLGHLVSRTLLCGEIGKEMGISADASDAVVRAQEKTADLWVSGSSYELLEKLQSYHQNDDFDRGKDYQNKEELLLELRKMRKAHEYDAAWNSFKQDSRFYFPNIENDRRGVNSWNNYAAGILSRGSVERLSFS